MQRAGVETQQGGSTMVRNKAPREAEQATSRGHSAQQQAVGVSPQVYAQRAAGDNACHDKTKCSVLVGLGALASWQRHWTHVGGPMSLQYLHPSAGGCLIVLF